MLSGLSFKDHGSAHKLTTGSGQYKIPDLPPSLSISEEYLHKYSGQSCELYEKADLPIPAPPSYQEYRDQTYMIMLGYRAIPASEFNDLTAFHFETLDREITKSVYTLTALHADLEFTDKVLKSARSESGYSRVKETHSFTRYDYEGPSQKGLDLASTYKAPLPIPSRSRAINFVMPFSQRSEWVKGKYIEGLWVSGYYIEGPQVFDHNNLLVSDYRVKALEEMKSLMKGQLTYKTMKQLRKGALKLDSNKWSCEWVKADMKALMTEWVSKNYLDWSVDVETFITIDNIPVKALVHTGSRLYSEKTGSRYSTDPKTKKQKLEGPKFLDYWKQSVNLCQLGSLVRVMVSGKILVKRYEITKKISEERSAINKALVGQPSIPALDHSIPAIEVKGSGYQPTTDLRNKRSVKEWERMGRSRVKRLEKIKEYNRKRLDLERNLTIQEKAVAITKSAQRHSFYLSPLPITS